MNEYIAIFVILFVFTFAINLGAL